MFKKPSPIMYNFCAFPEKRITQISLLQCHFLLTVQLYKLNLDFYEITLEPPAVIAES